jgi:hypothetical protein
MSENFQQQSRIALKFSARFITLQRDNDKLWEYWFRSSAPATARVSSGSEPLLMVSHMGSTHVCTSPPTILVACQFELNPTSKKSACDPFIKKRWLQLGQTLSAVSFFQHDGAKKNSA